MKLRHNRIRRMVGNAKFEICRLSVVARTQCLRRRTAPRPKKPTPRTARLTGSGVSTITGVVGGLDRLPDSENADPPVELKVMERLVAVSVIARLLSDIVPSKYRPIVVWTPGLFT